jgi:hypothetical protein
VAELQVEIPKIGEGKVYLFDILPEKSLGNF